MAEGERKNRMGLSDLLQMKRPDTLWLTYFWTGKNKATGADVVSPDGF